MFFNNKNQEEIKETEVEQEIIDTDPEDELETSNEVDNDDSDFDDEPELENVCVKLHSALDIYNFVRNKDNQLCYINKETMEGFYTSLYYFKTAYKIGVISSYQEISDKDYQISMLTKDVMENSNSYYSFNGFDEEEMDGIISKYVLSRYSEDAKKYIKNHKKFFKLLRKNDDVQDFQEFCDNILFEKILKMISDDNIQFEEITE